MGKYSEVRAKAKKDGVPWTDEEDKIIWPYYATDNPSAVALVKILAEHGFIRTANAIRTRGFKLRKFRYGEKQHVHKLAVSLPWK